MIKSIKTTSPSKKIGVIIDVWKEKNKLQQYDTYGFMELAHIESGGNQYYKTSNLRFNNDLELCDYDGNFPNGLPKYIFPILKENGFNPDEIQSIEEED